MLAVLWHEREPHIGEVGPGTEIFIVVVPDPLSFGLNHFTRFQLRIEERGENV